MNTPLRAAIVAIAFGLLAGCQSSEERADSYYQSALELIEEGDVNRALLELRNVFDHDGRHKEARQLYADLNRAQGNNREAYSQYLRLIEQYPDTIEVRHILAEMALEQSNWDEVRRHAAVAIERTPDEPRSQSLSVVLDYRNAVLDGNDTEAATAFETAREVVERDPDLIAARRVLIDWLSGGSDPVQALPHIDAALDIQPQDRRLHMARLSVLSQQNDADATGAQLQRMYELFPDDDEITAYLIAWYVSQEDFEGAEAFLRGEAGPDDAAPKGHMAVVELIASQQGAESALAELDRLATANEGTDLGRLYAAEAAGIRFQTGERDDAVAQMEKIVAEAEGSERRVAAKVLLARMKVALGEEEASRALVAEVLDEDGRNIEALKMQSAWLIRTDDFGTAVSNLRLALDQAPRNSETLMMLADAQQKAGNLELAQQRLAEAVEVSRNAPRESALYARFLMTRNQPGAAETVLTAAVDAAPRNLGLAQLLGEILLQRGRFEEAEALVQRLEDMQMPQAAELSRAMRAAVLFRQNRVEDSLAFLQSTIDDDAGEEDVGGMLQLVRLQVMSNRLEDALNTVDSLVADYPDAPEVQVLRADILTIDGQIDAAMEIYRTVLDENPEALTVIEKLYRLLVSEGNADEADALLEQGLASLPEARSLRLLEASRLEQEGRYQDAIAIYDALYDENSNDLITANNLASLLSVHSDATDDLDRAYTIALRLTGSRQPAFLDTLGWVQFRRGEVDQALVNLQAAARGLQGDPTVAFHLGIALAEAGRPQEARTEIERGLALANGRDVPQLDLAQETLAEL